MEGGSTDLERPRVRAHIEMGVCRFTCDIETYLVDGRVHCRLESGCPCVTKFGESLEYVDPCEALKMPYEENKIFQMAGKVLPHSTCLAPIALIKCVEIVSGLALARSAKIEFDIRGFS